jgi:hypothetical protein
MSSQEIKTLDLSQKSTSLEKIKRGFDPDYCYIIFEVGTTSEKDEVFEKVILFTRSFRGIIEKEIYYDKKKDRRYLLVKLEIENSDTLLEELSSIELSRELSFYVYGAR